MRAYHAHLELLTLAVYSPLHRRRWLITPRQYRLIVEVFGGWHGDQRSLAARTGYSPSGLHRAIESLVTGGVLSKLAARGRNGHTRLRLRPGVRFLGFARDQGNHGSEDHDSYL